MKKRPDWRLITGLVMLGGLLLLYVLTRLFTPYEVGQMSAADRFMRPSTQHPFGTDNFGRDILTRTMAGAANSLLIAFGTVLIGASGGFLIGSLSGYLGGWVDWILMRFNDALLSFPAMLMALLFVAVLGGGHWQLTVAMGILFIPSFARVIRSGFMQARNQDYVKRLRVMGASSWRIMGRHVLPGLLRPMISAATIGFANAILTETSLSYLGLGIPPTEPSWGRLLFDSQAFLFSAPWYALFPGLTLVLTVLAAFFVGGGIRTGGEHV